MAFYWPWKIFSTDCHTWFCLDLDSEPALVALARPRSHCTQFPWQNQPHSAVDVWGSLPRVNGRALPSSLTAISRGRHGKGSRRMGNGQEMKNRFSLTLALVGSTSAPLGKGSDGAARPTLSNEKRGIKQCQLVLIPPHCMGLLLYFVGTLHCSVLQHSLSYLPQGLPFPLPERGCPQSSSQPSGCQLLLPRLQLGGGSRWDPVQPEAQLVCPFIHFGLGKGVRYPVLSASVDQKA